MELRWLGKTEGDTFNGEPDILAVLKVGLQKRGFVVTAFVNLVEALNSYKAGSSDIILLDIQMPKMSGFELAKCIWKQDLNAHICFLTSIEIYEKEVASVFPSMKQRCLLRKPISIEQLSKHIENQLSLPAMDAPSF